MLLVRAAVPNDCTKRDLPSFAKTALERVGLGIYRGHEFRVKDGWVAVKDIW